jgi:uncharacterized membrane protein YdbT with pleckstrin-like domain
MVGITGPQDESRMSYVAEVLQPGETLRFRTNIHWFVYLKAILALIVGLALLGWYYAEGQSVFVLLFGGVVFTLTAVILAVPAWLRRFGTEVAVTDRRVIYKTGLVQRHTIEINIDKIESADVDQSILGRLFGFGSITIRGTGEGVEPLRNIAQPLQLRNAVLVR